MLKIDTDSKTIRVYFMNQRKTGTKNSKKSCRAYLLVDSDSSKVIMIDSTHKIDPLNVSVENKLWRGGVKCS